MDPELDKRLKSIEEQLEDNNKILKRIRRVQINAGIFRLLYWLIIAGIALGAFYYLAPYLEKVKDVYSGYTNLINAPEVNQLQNLWNQINGKK